MTVPVLVLGLLGVVLLCACISVLIRSPEDIDYLALCAVFAVAIFAIVADGWFASGNAGRISLGLLIVVLAVLAAAQGEDHSPGSGQLVPASSVAVVILALTMFAVNVFLVTDISMVQAFGRLLPCVVWACLAWLASTTSLEFRHVLLTLVAAFAVSCVLTLAAAEPWSPCTQFKCGPFGSLLVGPFGSENSFARIASIAFLAGLALRRNRILSGTTILAASFVLFATNSRTSQLALMFALVGWFIWSRRGLASVGLKSMYALILPIASLGLGAYLVYSANQYAFSNRGYIWTLGRSAVGGDWLVGRGIDSWTTDVLERNFMHSQFLLLLYSAGAVAVGLYVVIMVLMLRLVSTLRTGVGFALVVLMLVMGLAEIVWNPAALDGTIITILPMLLLPTLRNDYAAARLPKVDSEPSIP